MAEDVPKLMAYTKPSTQEVQRTPSRINTKNKQTKKENPTPGISHSQYRKPKTKRMS